MWKDIRDGLINMFLSLLIVIIKKIDQAIQNWLYKESI